MYEKWTPVFAMSCIRLIEVFNYKLWQPGASSTVINSVGILKRIVSSFGQTGHLYEIPSKNVFVQMFVHEFNPL